MHQSCSRLLYKGKGIFLQPEMSKLVGGRAPAQLLQQIHYFITSQTLKGKIHQEKKWIYQTLDQWAKMLGYSTSTIKNSIRCLLNLNLIKVEKLNPYKSNRTNYYTLDYQSLEHLLEGKINKKVLDRESSLKVSKLEESEQTKIVHSLDKICPMVITESTYRDDNKSYKSDNSLKQKVFLPELMLKTWNEIIKPDYLVKLTKKRCQYFMAVMKHFFNWDLQKWQHYCQLISSSDFLMGKVKQEFKASIDWVLKFDIVQRVLEGQYGIKMVVENKKDEHVLHQEILSEIDQEEGPLSVLSFAKKLFLRAYGVSAFKSWLKSESVCLEQKDNSLVIKCPANRFIKDELVKKFESLHFHLQKIGIYHVIKA